MSRLWILLLVLILCAPSAGAEFATFSTDHYVIHTDLDPSLAADMGHRMDVMWEEYSRRFGDLPDAGDDAKLQAYLFSRRADFVHLTEDRFPTAGGVFMPSKHLLAAFLEGQGREGLRRTLQHEAFHQFAQSAIGGHLPIWLNEGIAQIFQEGIWTGGGFLIGEVPPNRAEELRQEIRDNRLADFAEFINRTDEEWGSNMRYRPIAQLQYNQAWAMTQFLIYATDADGQPKYRDRLLEMLRLIRAGRDGHSAFVSAFSDNFDGFQARFLEWAQDLKPTAPAAYAEHEGALAHVLIALNERGQSFTNVGALQQFLTSGGYQLQVGSVVLSPAEFFRDLSGKPFNATQLLFDPTGGPGSLDLLCRPAGNLQLRTHFVRDVSGSLDYETVVDSE
jgi:hypothetical protein